MEFYFNNIRSEINSFLKSGHTSLREQHLCQITLKGLDSFCLKNSEQEYQAAYRAHELLRTAKKLSDLNSKDEALLKLAVNVQELNEVAKLPGEAAYPPLNLSILTTANGDANGAIFRQFTCLIQENYPFIASRELISGSQVRIWNESDTPFAWALRTCQSTAYHWDLFCLIDGVANAGLILFIPKTLLPNTDAVVKLRILGFNPLQLRPVSFTEALHHSSQPANLLDIQYFFSERPKGDKHIYLHGHAGGEKYFSGLSSEQFTELVEFFNRQNVKSLAVNACRSSGKLAAALLLPEEGRQINFAVYTRGLGEYAVRGEVVDNKTYFNGAHALHGSRRPQTIKAAKEFMRLATQGKVDFLVDTHQLLYPHKGNYHQRMQTLDILDCSASLTRMNLNRHLMESKHRMIIDRDYAELHEAIILPTLLLCDPCPALLSMNQGNSQHYLKRIELEFPIDCEEFINSFKIPTTSTPEYSGRYAKGFFIQKLVDGNSTYSHVFVLLHRGKWSAGFIEQVDGAPKCTIQFENAKFYTSLEVFMLETYFAFAVSQSLENREQNKKILENIFKIERQNGLQLPEFMQTYFNSAHKAILTLADFGVLAANQKTALLFMALQDGLTSLSIELADEPDLLLNQELIDGTCLLSLAINNKMLYVAKRLIEKGENIDKYAHINLLYNAVKESFLEGIDLLWDHKVIVDGNWPFYILKAALNNSDLFNKILQLDPRFNLNLVDEEGANLLYHAVSVNSVQQVSTLLGFKINLQGSSLNPLCLALANGSGQIAKMLVEAGIDLCGEDQSGTIPLVEAAKYASPELLRYIISQPGIDFSLRDAACYSTLDAVIERGNFECISAVIEHIRKAGQENITISKGGYLHIAWRLNDHDLYNFLQDLGLK